MAEQKVIMTDPRQEDYFYQEAIKRDYEEKSVNMIFYDKNGR